MNVEVYQARVSKISLKIQNDNTTTIVIKYTELDHIPRLVDMLKKWQVGVVGVGTVEKIHVADKFGKSKIIESIVLEALNDSSTINVPAHVPAPPRTYTYIPSIPYSEMLRIEEVYNESANKPEKSMSSIKKRAAMMNFVSNITCNKYNEYVIEQLCKWLWSRDSRVE